MRDRLSRAACALIGATLVLAAVSCGPVVGRIEPYSTVQPLLSTPAASTPTPAAPLPSCEWATMTSVVDGDTIHVMLEGQDETIRYIGVDTPETVHPQLGVQPYGKEASALNSELVDGQEVCLERDITERDRYARLLRYVWLADGTLVNEALLLAGLATVDTYPPDVRYVDDRYLPAQAAARDAGLGVWATSDAR